MDVAALRSHFPSLAGGVFLNAGTNGPLPVQAARAARTELDRELSAPRWIPHFVHRAALQDALRGHVAALVGAAADDVAITTSTTDGLGAALLGLGLGPGDEVVTSDEEHPGLLGPLKVLRERGVAIRLVPLGSVADAVGPATRAVAVSHVSWVSGALAPVDALAQVAADGVHVVYDGAQGLGAVPVDVAALGCAAYAAPGQKWLCGADGTGALYLASHVRARVEPTRPGYAAYPKGSDMDLDAAFHEDARRLETPALPAPAVAMTLAAVELLAAQGWARLLETAAAQASRLAGALADAGHEVLPRSATTLVTWRDEDADAVADRLEADGIVVRTLPGRGLLRASVGAWTSDEDVATLLAALGR